MRGRIVKLEYISPTCKVCGRALPKDRKRKCYYCLPPRGFRCREKQNGSQPAGYTLADRAAQADAYGISYGRLMACLENGWPLPARKKPVRWPMESEHWGEEQEVG